MRKIIITAFIFLGVAIGLLVGADILDNTIWHNPLLYLSGVFTGGLAALITLILFERERMLDEKSESK